MAHSLVALRHRLNAFFDDDLPQSPLVRMFNGSLAALIIVNVATVIAESVEPVELRYAGLFQAIEVLSTSVFAVEYVLRAWTAVDRVNGAFRHPFWGRIKYLRGFFALIDLIAILPALLGFFGAMDLRALRLLRLLRMLKLTRHSTIFSLIWAVLREEAEAIGAVAFVLCLILCLSGSLMYMVEHDAQPGVFSSIPAAMWWAVETVTTVGYGDMVPVTVGGRVLGTVISVIGILTFATFSGVITVGLMEQLKKRRQQYRRLVERRVSAGELTKTAIDEMAHIGDRLGLGQHEAAETIAEAIEDASAN